MRAFTVLAVTLCLSAAAGSATAQSKLDGWGQFRFGMTPDQARAAPGVSWPPAVKTKANAANANANASTADAMESLPMTSEYGPDTHVSLNFNADQKLQEIRLNFTDTQSAADCENAFQKTLARLDAKYGAFAGNAKDDWSVPGDSGQSLLERTSPEKLAGSRSGYSRRTILPNISGLNLETEARRAFGTSWIELGMLQKGGKNGCYRSIAFTADVPTKAQLETQFKLTHIPNGMDWRWSELDRSGRGFSAGPAQTSLSTGAAENVKLSGGRFAADIKRPAGGPATIHLVGTVVGNKISAHVPPSEVTEDFPTSFEGSVSMFTTDGEPVDTYEITLTGTGRWDSASLLMVAYHRTAAHTPAPEACRKIEESVYEARRTTREITYKGLLQALGCPPP